jgi:hypothetical protein
VTVIRAFRLTHHCCLYTRADSSKCNGRKPGCSKPKRNGIKSQFNHPQRPKSTFPDISTFLPAMSSTPATLVREGNGDSENLMEDWFSKIVIKEAKKLVSCWIRHLDPDRKDKYGDYGHQDPNRSNPPWWPTETPYRTIWAMKKDGQYHDLTSVQPLTSIQRCPK